MPQVSLPLIPLRETSDLAALKAARHRIRHRWRWGKGRQVDKAPMFWKYCALTALGNFSETVTNRLQAQLPRGFRHLARFNDHPQTTHADVLAMFDRAIAELECSRPQQRD